MENTIFRQGDLVIKKIDKTNLNLQKAKQAILAEGEHTGHMHRLTALDNTAEIEFMRDLDTVVFKVENGKAQLTHEEHLPIVFEPGTYTVTIQREFDYFADQIRTVLD